MILTPVPPARLAAALDRFAAGLTDPAARAAFAKIRATGPDRAEGDAAERDRQAALAWARAQGMAVHPDGRDCAFNWDGAALDPGTEAYVILHETAHFALAPPERRGLVDFGLGPGPDTRNRAAAERAVTVSLAEGAADEAAASLLGILWEAELGQPALASFLDQNWLEGLERSAAAHFEQVVAQLAASGELPSPSHGVAAGPSLSRNAGEGLSCPPLARIAGEGGARSAAGEGAERSDTSGGGTNRSTK